MAQWTNLQRIEKFKNPTSVYINCEKSGGLYLVEPGLTAGSMLDEIWVRLDILAL